MHMPDGWLFYFWAAVFILGLGPYLILRKKRGTLTGDGLPDYMQIMKDLPLGVVVATAEGTISWSNRYFASLVEKKVQPGMKIEQLLPGLSLRDIPKNKEYIQIIQLAKKIYYLKMVEVSRETTSHYLILCEDITIQVQSARKTQDSQPALAFIQVDNLADILRTMAEEAKPYLLGALEKNLAEWVGTLEGYLTRIGEGRYIVFFTEWGFKQAEKTRFAILDKIREIEVGNEMPLTISIGVGMHEENIGELGRLAQHSLDLALERGGDQVVAKSPEKVRFYGGKTVSIEKRTKVKARVMASALKELIQQSSQVVVMGHEMADYDSFGAALGIAKAVQDLGKKAWVVIDEHNPATDKLLAVLPKGEFTASLVKAGEAGRKMNDNKTLLVVVDANKPSLLANPKLLRQASQVVVIDHHRRGEEFINEAKLVYLESYASSTSELVTELLQYLGDQVEIGKAEATALLAGITVDTKNFMSQTGVRTFEAASYLRGLGAEPAVVKNILNDDLVTVVKKAEVIRNARILFGRIALGISHDKSFDAQTLAAKTADTMLNIAGVKASFVLWPCEGGIAVSARSNGEINVQSIMEKMGGGGHLTVAAAQLAGTLTSVEEQLLVILEEEFQYEKNSKGG